MDCVADRISNLPCGVINQILKYLPLRDSVRTSTLSKDWRYKWINTPFLVFDKKFQESLNGNHNLESIIDQTLFIHEGTITKFSLMDCQIKSHPAIHRWLLFLSSHRIRIEELALSFSRSSVNCSMSISLFGFDHLTHLNISNCVVRLPPTFRGFRRLIKLVLFRNDIEHGELKVLLSKCPMLEHLNLRISHIDLVMQELPDKLNHLTVLEIGDIDFGWLESVTFLLNFIKRCPNLQTLKIDCDAYYDEKPVTEYLKAQRTYFFPLSRLEDVKMSVVMGYAAEIEFVKIVLVWATSLKKLEMDSPLTSAMLDGWKELKELPSFQRASSSSSSAAEIILNTECFQ